MKFNIIENKELIKESASDSLNYILQKVKKVEQTGQPWRKVIPNQQINNSKFPYNTTHEFIMDLIKNQNEGFRQKNIKAIQTQNGLSTIQRIVQSLQKS